MWLLSAAFCISNQTRTNQSFGDAEVTFGIHTESPQSSSHEFYSYLCLLRSDLLTLFLTGNPVKNSMFIPPFLVRIYFIFDFFTFLLDYELNRWSV